MCKAKIPYTAVCTLFQVNVVSIMMEIPFTILLPEMCIQGTLDPIYMQLFYLSVTISFILSSPLISFYLMQQYGVFLG